MMGIFGNTSSFDPVVEKCTAETNTKEDWGLMLDICDKVGMSSEAPKDCFKAIMKRLRHQDPHVVILAITLMDTCVSNCGLPFHLEIASREFEQEYKKLLQKHQEKTIRDKLLSCLQKWAENEFKSDPQLDLIPTLYNSLRAKGYDFPSDSPSKSKKSSHHHHHHKGKEQAVVSAQQEEADLAKAIELSLKEAQTHGSPQNKSLYPQVSGASAAPSTGNGPTKQDKKEPRKVRALYDFEAAGDNELTFYSGEIVFVLDESDPNWWEGENQRGRGLFPANFVTPDLDAEPSQYETKKLVQFAEEVEVKSIETEPEVVEIDENKIDTVLHMLHEADPTGEVADPLELAPLEEQVQQMGPLIDQELEKIDRRHAQLTRLGGELVEALNMYHNLMRDPGIGPPVSLPYNMKMGVGLAGPTSSLPNFHPGGPIQHPYGAYPYDMNGYQNSMIRPPNQPPHSAPASGINTYGSMSYGPPSSQMNGVSGAQVSSPSHSMNSTPATVSIPNSQPTSMTQSAPIPNQHQPQSSAMGQMNPNVPPMTAVPGQIPYSSPMMMGQPGQLPMHMVHPQQTSASNAPTQMTNMVPGSAPNSMQLPPPGMPQQQQQFGSPAPPQFYSHPSTNAPAM